MPKAKTKKSVKKPWKTFSSIVIIFISVFLLNAAVQDFMTTLKLKNDIAITKAEMKALRQEKDELAQEKENMEDPEYVTRFARGKYMVSKPGEQVFKLPNKNAEESEE